MKVIKTLAIFLALCVLFSSFNISFDIKHNKINIEVNNAQAATTINSTVVNGPYLTSANARPQVLSNGWIVSAMIESTTAIRYYVSKDDGITWSQLCYLSGTISNISMCSFGTNIYTLLINTSVGASQNYFWKFDATTISNINLNGAITIGNIDNSQSSYGVGSDIKVDSVGVLHATWCSKNATYPNSFNIRYSKSQDDGTTWATPTQYTGWNMAGSNGYRPIIAIKNNVAKIIFDRKDTTSATQCDILCISTDTVEAWPNYLKNVVPSSAYDQLAPSATITSDGVIHVIWNGTDNIETKQNIRYSKSSDGGTTWSAVFKITNGNTSDMGYPCITSDASNNLYAYWHGWDSITVNVSKRFYKNGTWEPTIKITNNTTAFASFPSLCDNYKYFTEPLLIYQDNQAGAVKFTGNVSNPPTLQLTPMTTTSCSIIVPVEGMVKDLDINDKISIRYQIDNSDECIALSNIISGGIDVPITINNIDVRALSSGTHTLTIWAADNNGDLSQNQPITFNKTDAVKLSYANISPTSIELNISDINPSNTQYQITCNNSYITEEGTITKTPTWIRRKSNTITSTAIAVTGLEAKTKYTFQIRVRHSDEQDGIKYNSISCVTDSQPLPVPTNLSANSYSDKITLTWKHVTEATEYEVNADGVITTTSALSFNHNGLQPNTKHIYKVRARNQVTISEWSTLLKVSTKNALPTVLQNITSSAIVTAINLSWESVTNALGYEIEVDGKIIQPGTKTAYTYKGLKPNTQHTYRVRTIGISGTSQWSPLQIIKTTDGIINSTPQAITAIATNNTITLSWNAVNDAEGYDIILIQVDGTTGSAIDNGSLPTSEIRGLIPNTIYKYMVRAKNSAGEGPWSAAKEVTTCLLDTPQNINTNESDTSITFTWDTVTSAEGYELQINGETSANTITVSAFSLTGLTAGTEYKYNVRAISAQGNGAWSEEKTVFTVPQKPSSPTNVSATVSDSKITIGWESLADTSIIGYDVELDGVVLENDNETTYIHEGLVPYSMHTYRVRARNELVEGDWSTIRNMRTLPGEPIAPTNILIKSTQTGATLTWQPELGAAGYDLYVFKLDDSGKEVKVEEITNIAKTTYTHRRQTKGEEYRYRIRTRNIHGTSAWSGDIINNAIKAQCKKKNTIDLGLTATDIVDFSSYEMVVTYNSGVVEITDLSTLTGKPELTIGKIDDTGITIKEFSQGRIVFVVEKAVTPGEAWTGVINGIKFKAKETGGTTITYTVFEK